MPKENQRKSITTVKQCKSRGIFFRLVRHFCKTIRAAHLRIAPRHALITWHRFRRGDFNPQSCGTAFSERFRFMDQAVLKKNPALQNNAATPTQPDVATTPKAQERLPEAEENAIQEESELTKPPIAPLSLRILTLVIVVTIIYLAKMILLPILVAGFIALFASPLVRSLETFHIPKPAASLLLEAVLLGAFIYIAVLLFNPALRWLEAAPVIGSRIADRVYALSSSLGIGPELQIHPPSNKPWIPLWLP
ncbi:hypothetical protein DWB84_02460 [Saccharophagus sp. K07]|uniref:AI-2E family transporter n=1 Tax=Saccharophagus sp. K07 TaxID=2283636 RepID=UPI001652B49D|nr:hypothetical protein [Saccharophagus sp. K07]MBC6904332.1 hypothetical protein [Saccharophagus sp. K07]